MAASTSSLALRATSAQSAVIEDVERDATGLALSGMTVEAQRADGGETPYRGAREERSIHNRGAATGRGRRDVHPVLSNPEMSLKRRHVSRGDGGRISGRKQGSWRGLR